MTGDLVEAVTEGAKAVSAASDTVGKLVDAASGVAKFVAPGVEVIVALTGGDYFAALRERNRERLKANTRRIIAEAGVDPAEPNLNVAAPIIEAAADESDETLSELWAQLLAASLDPARLGGVRKEFTGTVKQLNPVDVAILRELFQAQGELGPNTRDFLRAKLNLPLDTLDVSSNALQKLNCVFFNATERSRFYLTPYGKMLMSACNRP